MLGTIALSQHDSAIAEKYWEDAVPFLENSNASYDQQAPANWCLATIYASQGKDKEAEKYFKENITLYATTEKANSLVFAYASAEYSEFLLKKNRIAEAEPLIRQAYKIVEKYGDNSESADDCRKTFGGFLLKTGHSIEAKTLLDKLEMKRTKETR